MIKEVEPKKGRRGARRRGAASESVLFENNDLSFGEKLAALRFAKGLNQKQVADEVSRECAKLLGREPITNRAVSKWERGDSLPDAQQFICLCRLYGVSDAHGRTARRPRISPCGTSSGVPSESWESP